MTGYPILLLHGLGVDHRMWALQSHALQEKGQILAPDLPGFGRQPPLAPGRRSPVAYADWVAAWLRDRTDGPAAVLGYSMGGSIALLLALRHPSLVRRLVLCCSSPRWGWGLRRPLARGFAGLGGRPAMELFQGTVAWSCSRFLPVGSLRNDAIDMVRRAHRPTMRSLYLGLAALNLAPLLGRLDLPALVVGGGRDWLAPRSHLHALARGLPRGRLKIFTGAGHLLCLSHSARFTEVLSRELAGPGPSEAVKESA